MSSHNLNHVTVTGNLAQEPALLDLPAGQCACELRIACNRRRQNKLTGVWDEWTDFFDARIVGALAPVAHRRLRKGHGVAIDGRLSTQPSRCEDPIHRSETVILVDEIQFLTRAADAEHTALERGALHPKALRPGDVLVTDEASGAAGTLEAPIANDDDDEQATTITPPASVQSMLLLEH
jgi:single stranded DNA-binding protein